MYYNLLCFSHNLKLFFCGIGILSGENIHLLEKPRNFEIRLVLEVLLASIRPANLIIGPG